MKVLNPEIGIDPEVSHLYPSLFKSWFQLCKV